MQGSQNFIIHTYISTEFLKSELVLVTIVLILIIIFLWYMVPIIIRISIFNKYFADIFLVFLLWLSFHSFGVLRHGFLFWMIQHQLGLTKNYKGGSERFADTKFWCFSSLCPCQLLLSWRTLRALWQFLSKVPTLPLRPPLLSRIVYTSPILYFSWGLNL